MYCVVLHLKELYGLGVRRIGVTSLPPVGCLPSQRTLRGGVERNCVEEYNEAAQLFNNKLWAELGSINAEFGDAVIAYIDIYNLPLKNMVCRLILTMLIIYYSCGCGIEMIEFDRIQDWRQRLLWNRGNRSDFSLQDW